MLSHARTNRHDNLVLIRACYSCSSTRCLKFVPYGGVFCWPVPQLLSLMVGPSSYPDFLCAQI